MPWAVDIMKRYLTLINLILMTLAIYLGVDLFYTIATSKMEVVSAPILAGRESAAATGAAHRPFADYQAISRRNLFNIKAADAIPKPPQALKIDSLKQTELKLTLCGTVTGSGQNDSAVIESKPEGQNLYHAGDVIQGATLKLILREKVILNVNGKDEILEMEKIAATGKAAAGERQSAPDAQNIPITRAQVESATKDINQLLQQVNIRPHFENGKPDGLMLSRIKSDSIFKQMGLANGDILTGVNGNPIQSVDNALSLYESLQTSGELSLEIKRRGRVQTIQYTLE